MFAKMAPQFGEYLKLGIYSSGITFAAIGYLFHRPEKCTKSSVLYAIYYPLLLQYPATFELFYGLISKKNNNSMVYKLLISTSFLSSIVIPFFHSKIHFSKPQKYQTRRLLTQLFDASNKKLMADAYFYAFSALSLSQIYSYFMLKPKNNAIDIEKIVHVKCVMAVIGLVFDKFVEKLKSILYVSAYNPPLTFNEINLFDPKHNYAMYVLFDLQQSVLPLEIASLCLEYCSGSGLMAIDSANTALSHIIYDCYNGNTREVMYQLLPYEDTRFVDNLCSLIQYDKTDNNDLAHLWIKNKMTPLYSAKPIYAGLLCLTTTARTFSDFKRLFLTNI